MTRKSRKPAARWMHHRAIAAEMGVPSRQIGRWLESGLWPEPISRVGKTLFWRVEDARHYLETGRWPDRLIKGQ